MKYRYQDLNRTPYKPRDIITEMERNGVYLTYKKAWRSREKAMLSLVGTVDDSFAAFPSYAYMLGICNPGSVIDLVTDDQDQFVFFFMSLAAFIEGWQHCRPVIICDGAFLKTKQNETLFTACAMDANEQIFPLAFGVGPNESNATWDYFFSKLKEAIGDRDELVVVSDRHRGIISAVEKHYPYAEHGFCMHHLYCNLKSKYNHLPNFKGLHWKFDKAAKAYSIGEWESCMLLLDNEDPDIRNYLARDVGNKKWARSHFNGRRYSIMTSNNAESMNALDKEAREYPALRLLDYLRAKMQEWFYERREKAAGTFTVLSPAAEKRLVSMFHNSQGMTVSTLS